MYIYYAKNKLSLPVVERWFNLQLMNDVHFMNFWLKNRMAFLINFNPKCM